MERVREEEKLTMLGENFNLKSMNATLWGPFWMIFHDVWYRIDEFV